MLGLSFLSPKEKVQVGPFELGYYTPRELLGVLWQEDDSTKATRTTPKNAVLDALIEEADTFATPLLSEETELLPVVEPVILDTAIQLVDVQSFSPFFEALKRLSTNSNSRVRILHFGDSQLEGDRSASALERAAC